MGGIDDANHALSAAERSFDAAEASWERASAAYRAAYARSQRPKLDEEGLETGALRELSYAEIEELAQLEDAEAAAWRRRQAARRRRDDAERRFYGGGIAVTGNGM